LLPVVLLKYGFDLDCWIVCWLNWGKLKPAKGMIQPNRIHRCKHSPSALTGTGWMRAGWVFENAEVLPLGATI